MKTSEPNIAAEIWKLAVKALITCCISFMTSFLYDTTKLLLLLLLLFLLLYLLVKRSNQVSAEYESDEKLVSLMTLKTSLYFTAQRRTRILYRGKYRRVRHGRRYTIRLGTRRYPFRKFKRGALKIRVFKRYRPLIRRRKRWYVRIGSRFYHVRRQGRRYFIMWNKRPKFIQFRPKIEFRGKTRILKRRCGGRWVIRLGRRWRRIKKQRKKYVRIGRRRYRVRKGRRGKYRIRVARRWKRVKARRRQQRR